MKLTVLHGERTVTVTALAETRLADVLFSAGLSAAMPCGGKGRCGRCRVKFITSPPSPTEAERRHLTASELADGWRLACVCRLPDADEAVVELPAEGAFSALATAADGTDTGGPIGVALDLGTTTLAMALVDLPSNAVFATATAVNRGRVMGADVLSRIRAAVEGEAETLRRLMQEDIDRLLWELLDGHGVDACRVTDMVIAANTTMVHLLCDMDVSGLGVSPFTPVTLSPRPWEYGELIGRQTIRATVRFVSGISAFVGGDIVAGLIATRPWENEGAILFVDLGTNGEMAYWRDDCVTVTSVAAGPAFEGGGLSSGVGSVVGAICRVDWRGNRPQIETIGKAAPIGLCGTGALEALAVLRDRGAVDKTGTLAACYPDGVELAPTVRLTQADIRCLQMAKAAVRAGAETLCSLVGGAPDEVWLAGGFGQAIAPDKAKRIGLLAPEWTVKAVGNTAFDGAVRLLTDETAWEEQKRIVGKAREVTLATDPTFASRYMQAMDLTERG